MWKCIKCETNNQDTDEKCIICNSCRQEVQKRIPVKLITNDSKPKVEMETLEQYITTTLYKSEKPEKLEIYNEEDTSFNYKPQRFYKQEWFIALIKSPVSMIFIALLIILVLQFI